MGKNDNDQIDKLPGVGPATAEKLKDAGYTDILRIFRGKNNSRS